MQLRQFLRVHNLDLLELTLAILVDEFVNGGEAATHPDDKFVVRNLRKNSSRSKHVKATAKSGNGQLHSALVDVASKQLINEVTLYGFVCIVHGVFAQFPIDATA